MRMFRVGSFVCLVVVGCSRSNASSADAGGMTLAQAMASGIAGNMAPGVDVNTASGHVESTGSTGTWTFDGGTCYSGDNDGYFGVFVKSKTDKHVWLKLVKDPIKQWTLGVSDPGSCKAGTNGDQCDLQYFDSSMCTKLDVGFQSYTFRGRRTGGGHQFDGTTTFDCKSKDAHVSGSLTVAKCSP